MKIVGMYPDSFEASLAKGRLEEAGIEACLLNEYINSVVPYAPPEERMVKLGVADEDYRAAMELLAPEGRQEAKVCPFCGSERVSLGLRGRRRWGKVLWLALAALTMAPPGKVQANYFCEECKREF